MQTRFVLRLISVAFLLFIGGSVIFYQMRPVLAYAIYRCLTGAESVFACIDGKPTGFKTTMFGMVYEGNTGDLLDRHVLGFGAYEKPELFFLRDVSRGGVFVDIGANKGVHSLFMLQFGEIMGDLFLPYRVNVFVDNSDMQGPPVVVETNPTYHNVFGVIEKKPVVGGYTTDFTIIKAGSISRANGGYLVLYDRDVLANAGVWEALQRVIKNREVRIEEPGAFFGFVPPQGLRPEPIPTDTKIIMRTISAAL